MKNMYCLFLFLLCLSAAAQREVNSDWKRTTLPVFASLDHSRIPTGILLDQAMEFANIQAYNGIVTDSTFVNASVMGNIYKTLLMARATTDTTYFPRMETFAKNWRAMRVSSNRTTRNTLVLGGLLYQYAFIDSTALAQGKIAVVNGAYTDVISHGVWQNPYKTSITAAIAAPLSTYNRLDFNVLLPKSLFMSNIIGKIGKIEADFSDGLGKRTVAFDKSIPLKYAADGSYQWKFKINFLDGTAFNLTTIISIFHHQTASQTTGIAIPGYEGAILKIDYAPSHLIGRQLKLIKPLIVAEGFDIKSVTNPEMDGGDRTLSDFQSDISTAGSQLYNLLGNDNSQQYDIVYVDWNNGMDDIRHNAAALRNVINYVNSQKALNGSTEKNVLIGQSMGGLISRYALAKMEHDGEAHDVRLFVAHDSPMQGANVPLSAQFFCRHMYGEYVESPILYATFQLLVPMVENFVDLMNSTGITNFSVNLPNPEQLLTLFDTPGAMQMMYSYVDMNSTPTHDVHQSWQQEFDTMGYPHNSVNIAISDGNECAGLQTTAPFDTMAAIHTVNNTSFLGDLLDLIIAPSLGVLTSNIELVLLGIFPGKSTYLFDFDLRTTPTLYATNRTVYNGKIRYRKKLLWIGPTITINLTNRENTAPSGYLPYDSYPGGYYDLHQFTSDDINVPGDLFVHSQFGFVPTASALDVRKVSQQPLTDADYRKRYSGGVMPDTSLQSQFHNFIVGFDPGSVTNYPHISFQPRNGTWLANQLNGTETFESCTFMCSNEITGPQYVCSSASFSAPQGADTQYWYVSPSNAGTVTYGQGTTSVTVTFASGFSGNATVSAVLSSARCNGSATLSKTVAVSSSTLIPSIQGIYCPTLSAPCYVTTAPANNYFMFTLEVPASPYTPVEADYQWEWISGNCKFLDATGYNSHSYTGKIANIYLDGANPTNAPLYFKVRVHNPCGWGDWHTYTWNDGTTTTTGTGGTGTSNDYFIVSPVPSNTYVNINMVNPYAYPNSSFTVAIYSIPPYPGTPPVLPTTTLNTNAGSTSFNTTNLPNGPYLISITGNNISEGHSIMVQH